MQVIFLICALVLCVSAALTIWRVLLGPSSLDRLISMDMMVSIIICGLCLWCVYVKKYYLVPTIITLSLLSFLGTVTVARYRVRDDQKPDI